MPTLDDAEPVEETISAALVCDGDYLRFVYIDLARREVVSSVELADLGLEAHKAVLDCVTLEGDALTDQDFLALAGESSSLRDFEAKVAELLGE